VQNEKKETRRIKRGVKGAVTRGRVTTFPKKEKKEEKERRGEESYQTKGRRNGKE